jgi:hypothetical protein
MHSTRARLINPANPSKALVCALAFSGFVALTLSPASAMVVAPSGLLQQQARQDSLVTEVRARAGGAVRRTTVVGPRGGAASRTVVRGGAVVRPGYVRPGYAGGGVRWARPGWYRWPAGGAIAAGAAIGFVAAASAAAYAGAPPAPGMCWYYTDPSRTQGFWDACP